MVKLMKYVAVIIVLAIAFVAVDVAAQVGLPAASGASTATGTGLFGTVVTRLVNTFKNVRAVIFVIGGFGLIVLGFAAIFGRVKWPWLGGLAFGLALVAVAGLVVDYVTQNSANTENIWQNRNSSGLGNTLTESSSPTAGNNYLGTAGSPTSTAPYYAPVYD